MKDVAAFAPYYTCVSDGDSGRMDWKLTQRTVVAWDLASRAASFVGYATYATHITLPIPLVVIHVSCVPSPLSDSVP